MLYLTLATVFIVYAACVWRLRGGAWANVGVHIGTNTTRLATGLMLAGPIAMYARSGALFVTITIAITVGLMLAGWGSYMGMGVHSRPNKMQWSDYPALFLRMKPETVLWDCLGMITTTIPMFTLIVLSFGIVSLTMMMVPVTVVGVVLFTFVYWITSKAQVFVTTKENGIVTSETQPWSEFASGAVVGLTLLTLVAII